MANDGVLFAFVIVVTVAVLIQGCAMLGMWLAVRRIPCQIEQIRVDAKQRFDPLTQLTTEILTGTRDPLKIITTNLAEISQTMRERSSQVDTVMEDLVEKARVQVIRADQLMTSLADKVETTTDKVQETVIRPLNEASAVIKGIQSGLEFLFFRRRPVGASEATQDEQMFI